jgi:hypothetical protein
MKQISFTLSGTCLVPDGTIESEEFSNHVVLPDGQIISIQPVVEMGSDPGAGDYRDLTYDEAAALGIYIECDERSVELDEEAV